MQVNYINTNIAKTQSKRQVNNIKQQNINFKSNNEDKSGKNGVPAIASLIMPGIGQMMNGEKNKGITHLAGWAVLAAIAKTALESNKAKSNIVIALTGLTAGIAALACKINSTLQAYNYKKPENIKN